MGLEGTEIQISKMAANKWAKMILGDGGGAGRIRAPAKRRRRLRSCISSRATMLRPTHEAATFVCLNLGLESLPFVWVRRAGCGHAGSGLHKVPPHSARASSRTVDLEALGL